MADRKTKSLNDDCIRPEKIESNVDFLAKTGVNEQIQEVLSQLLDNKPEDPLVFIADYFANLAEHVVSMNQAYQCLCLCHYTNKAFPSNLLKAYTILNNQKCGRGLKGLTGRRYNELLQMLCRDVKSREAEVLLQLLSKREHDVVRFNLFVAGVTCSLIFKDYLKEAQSLFQLLDTSGKDVADKDLCSAMLSQLSHTVSNTTSSPLSILEAGVSLSTQKVDVIMKKALTDSFSQNTGNIMELPEFITMACDIFFSKVPGVDVKALLD